MSHNSFELSKIVHSKEDRTHKFMSHLWSLKRSGRSNGRSPLGSCGLGLRSPNLKCLMRMELHILNVVETPKRMPFCCGHVLYSITASLSSYTHKPYHYVIFITTARHLYVCMHAEIYVHLCMYAYYACIYVHVYFMHACMCICVCMYTIGVCLCLVSVCTCVFVLFILLVEWIICKCMYFFIVVERISIF